METHQLILDTLRRLEDKVDAMDQRINGRIKSLEVWRAELNGAKLATIAVVSVVVNLVVAAIGWLYK